jgi:hypothetical protein
MQDPTPAGFKQAGKQRRRSNREGMKFGGIYFKQ